MFISLEKQMQDVEDRDPYSILNKILHRLGIDERGGGPEGIYYTHPMIEGEYLFRSLPILVYKIREYYESPTRQ